MSPAAKIDQKMLDIAMLLFLEEWKGRKHTVLRVVSGRVTSQTTETDDIDIEVTYMECLKVAKTLRALEKSVE
jgi:hypothetical protein